MLNAQLWLQGGTTVLIGMSVVFSFLIITIFAITIMAKIVAFIDKICPPVIEEAKTKAKAKTTDEADIALAVLIAQKQG
ncbi:MAG: OadG family protein [Candidatus Gastranaerophilales bacterium]|nr:OadG family protein [Candidatus Gastranaerophilales bacterium]